MGSRLFLDDLPERDKEFRKEAGFTHRLSENPDNWSQEVGSELYRQLPFLSDYEVNVQLDKMDQGRGFAFGYADISNKTERPEIEHDEAGIPHVRIPIIAEERQVRPFSVYLDGEQVLPMSEDRFKETLFNPSTFDLSNSIPRDPSLVEPLMPPQRSGIGLGGEYKMASIAEQTAGNPISAEKLPYELQKYKDQPDLLKKAIELEKRLLAINKSEKPFKQTPMSPHQKKRDRIYQDKRALELELAERVAKNKTAAMKAVPLRFLGSGGLQEVVDEWQVENDEHNKKPLDLEKTAFKHISEAQWKAINTSDKVRRAAMKHGTYDHPEVTNIIYETAAKHYGYHPRVYPMSAQTEAEEVMKQHAKVQKQYEKNQKMYGSSTQLGGQVKKASLLEAISGTIREKDRDAFIAKVASDASIRAGFRRSGIANTLISVLDSKLASADDRLSALSERIEPSVVTLQKLPGGDFFVKTANVSAFAGGESAKGQILPFAEVAEAIGEDNAQKMQPGQVATVVSDPIEVSESKETTPTTVSEFGEYRVHDKDGNELKGVVFPEMINWAEGMEAQPINFFAGSGNYALQDSIVGEKINDKPKINADVPKGEGVFWSEGQVTAPITISHGITNGDGAHKYVGSDTFGNQITVSLVQGLKTPKMINESSFALPADWKFMKAEKMVNLANDVERVNLKKSLTKEKNSAVLFFNGSFNVTGGCGLEKISSDLRQDLDAVGAEFVLGLLGIDGVSAKQKVAEARKKGHIKLSGLKKITTLAERFEESVKTASAFISKLPDLRRDLIKEAAALEDQGTVDKVLALNFINPENLSTFVEYLPELEETSERMAEMVLAGYLGMKEIPVGAVERTMHNMEEVIEGLKAIQHSQT